MFHFIVGLLVLGVAVAAQDTSPLPPDIQATVERIRRQNHPQPDAVPPAEPRKETTQSAPAELVTSEELAADIQDNQILLRAMQSASADQLRSSKTLRDATEQNIRDMVAAAERMADRAAKRVERLTALAADGSVPAGVPAKAREQAENARQTLELATERAAMLSEIIEMARADEQRPGGARMVNLATMRYDGAGRLIRPAEMATLSAGFFRRFSKRLPVSAWGESTTHALFGFDHRGRIDVAVNPDGPEGLWIRSWLERQRIPYYAFRSAVLGRATGPHIHIGPGSARVQALGRRATSRRAAD